MGQHAPKALLRRELKARRTALVASLDAAERTRLEAMIAGQVAKLLSRDQRLASYVAFGGEISMAQLAGVHEIALPRVAGLGLPLTFHHPGSGPLLVSRFGVAEPPLGLPEVDPDVLLVPLLGVDRRGHRIGYGAGHYDRTLAALRQRRRVVAIGCAWDCQLVDEVPTDEWDEPLDAVATPTGLFTIAGS